jgi:hypothetical protein
MAKAPKRNTIADSLPTPSTWDDWMPLTAAFQHIQQVVGGEELAEEYLRQRVAAGEVQVQDRQVTRCEGIDIVQLTPEDCVGPYASLFPEAPELDGDIGLVIREAHRRDNLLRRIERLRHDGHNFFLRRADVYRIWPIAGGAKRPRQGALPTARPKELRPKPWLAAKTVWELWVEGYRWTGREQLRRRVCERIGDEGLSIRTLDEALAYLRRKRLIDR